MTIIVFKEMMSRFFLLCMTATLQFSFMGVNCEIGTGLENSPLTQAYAVEGGRVLLPCDMDPPMKNDSTHLVLFYFGNAGTPIYSLDCRDGDLESATHWAEETMVRRTFVKTLKDPGALRQQRGLLLDEVTTEDQGEYRCRVDFLRSPTRYSRIQLTVVVPPENIEITGGLTGKKIYNGTVGPYTIGTKLNFSCSSHGGNPRPHITWWNGESLLDDVSEVISGQITSNELSLPPLTREDFNKTLTCIVSNSDLLKNLKASINIDMKYPPQNVIIEKGADKIEVKEGATKRISCEVMGSSPPAEVFWKIGNKEIPHTSLDVMTNILKDGRSSSVLTFIPLYEHNHNIVECTANTPGIPDVILKNTTSLSVLYKPRMKLQAGEESNLNDIRESDDLILRCSVDSNPQVTGIDWQHNGIPLRMLSTTYSNTEVTKDGHLKLRNITREESGRYTCSAHNTQGTATSNTLHVKVKYAPVCRVGQKKLFSVPRHEHILVPCSVDAHPRPSSFRWAVNTSTDVMDIDLSMYQRKGRTSTLTYTPQNHLDFSYLLCWAQNEIGQQQEPCVFKVIYATKPDAVSECKSEHKSTLSSTYLMVSCNPGSGGGLDQSFTLEVRQQKNQQVMDTFTLLNKPHFIITGLKSGVEYLLTVTPANSLGLGPPVTLKYTETNTSANKVVYSSDTTIISFTPLLVVLFGVFFGVLLCVGVGFAISMNKWRRINQEENTCHDSMMELRQDNQDLPTIMLLNKKGEDVENEEEDQFDHSMINSSQTSLFVVNPAKELNHQSHYSLKCEALLAKTRMTLSERRAPLSKSRDSLEDWPSPGPFRTSFLNAPPSPSTNTHVKSFTKSYSMDNVLDFT